MSKFWRIALAWLLAMALPIQGYAAQTLLLCAPAGHQAPAMAEHGGHDHARMLEAAKAAPADDGGHAQHAGKCSVCSACCNAVALTSAVPGLAVAPPDLPEVPTLQAAHDRVMVGGLDRPPRSSRA
ncbi:MAG: hypothetical protein GXC94_05050 [Comamonadaceae bacterium]|jgi:hypothetical protein|nr:hypothetical protein [Comamonadaceae bacterium]